MLGGEEAADALAGRFAARIGPAETRPGFFLEIGELLNLNSTAVRKRWQNIKSILHMEFAPTLGR